MGKSFLRATVYNNTKKGTSNEISFFVVRSTGIEDIRRYKKSLDFQGFFTIERQRGRQNFFGEGMILQVLFNSKNKPNMERIVVLWHFTYLVNLVL